MEDYPLLSLSTSNLPNVKPAPTHERTDSCIEIDSRLDLRLYSFVTAARLRIRDFAFSRTEPYSTEYIGLVSCKQHERPKMALKCFGCNTGSVWLKGSIIVRQIETEIFHTWVVSGSIPLYIQKLMSHPQTKTISEHVHTLFLSCCLPGSNYQS